MTSIEFSGKDADQTATLTVECANPDDETGFCERIEILMDIAYGMTNDDLRTMPGTLVEMARRMAGLYHLTKATAEAAKHDHTWSAFREGILSGKQTAH